MPDEAVQTWTPAPRAGGWPTRLGRLLVACAVVLLPWTVVLALTLPTTATARHWTSAWIGLDVLEVVALAMTGRGSLRRDPGVAPWAGAAAALLVADAWFDVATAQPRLDYAGAIVLALVVELPLAAACAALARAARRWPRS